MDRQSIGVLEPWPKKRRCDAVRFMRTGTRGSPSWPMAFAQRPDTLAQTERARLVKSLANGASIVRRETGKEWSVQVRYDEGVATHIGPKPCIGAREGAGEASVGERIGQQLSHEKPVVPDAAVFMVTEGDTLERVTASAPKVRRGRRTWHVRKLFVREPGGLGFGLRMDNRRSASGRRGVVAGDGRTREV